MRVAIYTLGCKVNQYETQAMEQELRRRGHELVDFEDSADAYIVNTCSVTAVSDKKSRQMIRRAKRRSPNAVVAACVFGRKHNLRLHPFPLLLTSLTGSTTRYK